jgi:hypothetical protein
MDPVAGVSIAAPRPWYGGTRPPSPPVPLPVSGSARQAVVGDPSLAKALTRSQSPSPGPDAALEYRYAPLHCLVSRVRHFRPFSAEL